MSLTTKGSKAWTEKGRSPAAKAATSARSTPRRRAPPRSEQPGEVIEKRQRHQHRQHRDADALADLEGAIGNGTTLQQFDEIIQQMPPIQKGNGQKVQYAEADADESEVADERERAGLRRLPREVGHRERSADVLERRL